MSKIRVYLLIGLILLGLSALVYFLWPTSKDLKRDVPTLLNQYMRLQDTNPWRAKEALDLILQEDPTNRVAIRAKAFWYIKQGDTNQALAYLETMHQTYPKDEVLGFQLAKLYVFLGKKSEAKDLLAHLMSVPDMKDKEKILTLFKTLAPEKPQPSPIPKISADVSYIAPLGLGSYDFTPLYKRARELRKIRPELSKQYFEYIVSMSPSEKAALLELGYLALEKKKLEQALSHFIQAFKVSEDPNTALQIGFILAKLERVQASLVYFQYGIEHGDEHLRAQSLKALRILQSAESLKAIQWVGTTPRAY